MIGNKRITIFAGHNGSGKTLLSVNYALKLRKAGFDKVIAVDMDTVKPYFRLIDAETELCDAGVRIIAPELVKSTVDLPTLPGEMRAIFDTDAACILDVGGDDAGAIALGQYQAEFESCGYDLFLIVNPFRIFTQTPEAAVKIMREIEAVSHLHFTGIIHNPNLGGEETDESTLTKAAGFARKLSEISGLPIVATAYLDRITPPSGSVVGEAFPIKLYRRHDWQIFDV